MKEKENIWNYFEDLAIDVMMILKCILKKEVGSGWTRLIRHRVQTSGELLSKR
jgi:hypothetical protein